MAKVNARLVTKAAPLCEEFGEAYATRLFGAEALAELPRYVRGKHAGKLKGFLHWVKAETGGWSRYGVAYPNSTVRAWIGAGAYSHESEALSGMWLGRIQHLCGSACYLGEENRAAEMTRQAAENASREAEAAEMRATAAEIRANPHLYGANGCVAEQIAEALERKAGGTQ